MIEYKLKERKERKHSNTIFKRGHSKLKVVPEVKPLSFKSGAFMYMVLCLFGISMGAAIGTYVFFGIVSLAGLIALSESNKYIRFLIVKSNRLLDILVFGATICATIFMGVTIAASLTFAGLGYTLVYAPWLRSQNVV